MKAAIKDVRAREILSTSAQPTIETVVTLEDGTVGVASVPYGTSAGKYEAVTLVDGDPKRYKGKGMLKAVKNVNELIGPKVQGNPHKVLCHNLLKHGCYVIEDAPRDFAGIREWLMAHSSDNIEGIVWHHQDGRMAKVKRRDFGLDWPVC